MLRINSISKGANWLIWQLEDLQARIKVELVPGAGAIINAWWVGDQNIVDGYQDRSDFERRVLEGFRSAKLSPFVCRLHEAAYTWEHEKYRLDKFLLNGSALHGILYDLPFDVVDSSVSSDHCSIHMQCNYDGSHPGYPFPYQCHVMYTLSNGGVLKIRTTLVSPATNTKAIPITDGWHPYFRLGGKVDQWWLKIGSDHMMEYNDLLIPTGRYVVTDEFLQGRAIGDLKLDNGFLLLQGASPLCTLRNNETGLTVRFLHQLNYPYLQLYIPDSRETIAIENLSGAPDAFNNSIGLTVLKPGEEKNFEVEIQAGFTP